MKTRALLLLLCLFGAGQLWSLPVKKINSENYVLFDDFLAIDPAIRGNWNASLKIAEVDYKQRKVRFEVDQKYYLSSGLKVELQQAPVLLEQKLYLPQELLEELLSELALPVKYSMKGQQIEIKNLPAGAEAKSGLDFIIIDPGHGGKDPGAFGLANAVEKEIVLQSGRSLFYHLKKEFPEVKIYITRFNDDFVSLPGRAEIANQKLGKNSAGLFISLHCNAVFNPRVQGYEIFYLAENPSNENARQTTMRENEIVGDENLYGSILESYLLNARIQSESKLLARELHRIFMTSLSGLVRARGVKKADFAVLRGALMPAILIEMGYITNSSDARAVQSAKYRHKMNEAVSDAVRVFIKRAM